MGTLEEETGKAAANPRTIKGIELVVGEAAAQKSAHETGG